MANLVNYIKKIWQDAPSTQTPINAENLNHMENGIAANANAINSLGESVSELNSDLSAKQNRSWNLVANVTGAIGVPFTDLQSYNELLLMITTPSYHVYTIPLLRAYVTSASVDQFFGTGDYQSTTLNSKIQVKSDATRHFIRLNAVYENGTEVTSTSRLAVHAR